GGAGAACRLGDVAHGPAFRFPRTTTNLSQAVGFRPGCCLFLFSRSMGALRPDQPLPAAGRNAGIEIYVSFTRKTARKASCGISTLPTRFLRRFPAICFSTNLRLRVM